MIPAERLHAIPLSLYVHFPWCVRKCFYCDFNSYAVRVSDPFPESAYLAALIADLNAARGEVEGRKIRSIFLGGGTPSLFSGEGIARLLSAVRERLEILPEAEITLEANPGAMERDQFAAFSKAGINRLSLGIQSFNANRLKALGRVHDDKDACRAIEAATKHFPVVNLDLMYGLPGQTRAQAREDIERALDFSPAHLSCYQLTIETETAFGKCAPELPDADLCADMQESLEEKLAENGYIHYETSAFARPGRECRHNLNYWRFGDYLGLGAGAHSKLTCPGPKGAEIRRQTRWKQPERYIEKALSGEAAETDFPVAEDDLPIEFMMNALRLVQGFEPALFEARTFLPLERVGHILTQASKEGWIESSDGQIRPTLQGQRFLNRLLAMFVLAET